MKKKEPIITVNPKQVKLSPLKFKEWYQSHNLSGDWKEAYLSIGGKLKTKRASKSS